MKKLSLLAILIQLFFFSSKAQVGINILNPDSSAILQLESNSKGLGLPRLNSTQRDSISNPLNGLTIFNTQDSLIEYWNGACWLKAYQRNCTECEFTMSLSSTTDTLDRTVSDSTFTTITLAHTNGNEPISLLYLSSLPPGVTIQLVGPSTIDSSATEEVVVTVDQCLNVGGNFPVILEAFCGDQILFTTYSLYIRPPVQAVVPTDATDYNLQTINGLPTSPAQFVLLTINQGVTLHASTDANPAFTTGNLDPNSLVCIVNNGDILGRGGDGGGFVFSGGAGFSVGGNPGKIGGDAMHLTTRTVLTNLGAIYGGGSGGGSVGFAASTGNIPIIGSFTLGFGFCGGGGSEDGVGGSTNPGGITIGLFDNGGTATCCVNSTPGAGPTATYPISIPISIASLNITPTAYGGNGGPFGATGTKGYINVTLQVCISIPFLGNECITIPIPGGFLPYYGPASPGPGEAIKHSNTLSGILDGTYSTTQVKGVVGP